MKNLLLSLSIAVMLLLQACGSKSESSNTKNEKAVSAASTVAIRLTRSDFIAKVIDYTKGAENLKYLGDKPCIIDFYASWCGPCKIAGPILEELAKEYEGRIYVYKVNTEEERQLSSELGIQGIPAFFYFPMDGKPISSTGIAKTPAETKRMFKEIIEKELLKVTK